MLVTKSLDQHDSELQAGPDHLLPVEFVLFADPIVHGLLRLFAHVMKLFPSLHISCKRELLSSAFLLLDLLLVVVFSRLFDFLIRQVSY